MAKVLSRTGTLNSTHLQPSHTFSLKSLEYHQETLVDFQTHFHTDNTQNYQTCLCTFPTFNNDKNHFTPAFTVKFLTSDPTATINNNQQTLKMQLTNFEQKKRSSTQPISNKIYMAKPESNYCQICREKFDDYKKHIDHPIHAKKLKQGGMESDILNLIQNFHTKSNTSLKRLHPTLNIHQKRSYAKDQQELSYWKVCKKIKKYENGNQLSVLGSNLTQAGIINK